MKNTVRLAAVLMVSGIGVANANYYLEDWEPNNCPWDHVQAKIVSGSAVWASDPTQVPGYGGNNDLPGYAISKFADNSNQRIQGNWSAKYNNGTLAIENSSYNVPVFGSYLDFKINVASVSGPWACVVQFWDSTGGPGGTPVLRMSMKFTITGTGIPDNGGWSNVSELGPSLNDYGFSGTGSPVYVNSGPARGALFKIK